TIAAYSGLSVAASQNNFSSTNATLIVGAASQHRTLCLLEIQGLGVSGKKLFLAVVGEHFDQRGIGVEYLSFRRAEVNALLQSLEQLGKACFLLALLGHVPGESADADNLIVGYDGVEHAIEVQDSAGSLDLDPDES